MIQKLVEMMPPKDVTLSITSQTIIEILLERKSKITIEKGGEEEIRKKEGDSIEVETTSQTTVEPLLEIQSQPTPKNGGEE